MSLFTLFDFYDAFDVCLTRWALLVLQVFIAALADTEVLARPKNYRSDIRFTDITPKIFLLAVLRYLLWLFQGGEPVPEVAHHLLDLT